jgi:hypothetical protein
MQSESINSFVPRPFPPPPLIGIPLEYIVDSLRKLAPRYWNNTETADCSIGEYCLLFSPDNGIHIPLSISYR